MDRSSSSTGYGKIAILLLVFLVSAMANVGNNYLGVAILTILLAIITYRNESKSLSLIIIFSGSTLFVLPYLSLIHVGEEVQVAWFAVFLLFSLALIKSDESRFQIRPGGVASGHSPTKNVALMALYMAAGLYLTDADGVAQVSFGLGWSLALIHLERVHAATKSRAIRVLALMIFFVFLTIFVAFVWGGFGRIIIAALFIAPLLLSILYGTFSINVLLFGAAAGVLPFIGRILRFGWSGGLAGLAEDSGATHILVTSLLWRESGTVVQPGSLTEQWLLFFFNWVPRDTWPEKPLGIGLTFVDMVQGRQGVSLEHSTATGLVGEHLFYLPTFWWLSLLALLITMILIRRAIGRLSHGYLSVLLAFDVNLITIFWGGMAAFGARAWFAVIPMLVYVVMLRLLERAKIR